MATITGRYGSGYRETLNGTASNDLINPMGGSDIVNGGGGIDTIQIAAARASFQVSISGSNATVVQIVSGASGGVSAGDTVSLNSVERVQFSNTKLALDVNGNAGAVAKILGAVFGASAVGNASYMGIGLGYLDGGMSVADLSKLALNAKLGTNFSNAAEITLFYQNLVGMTPNQDDIAGWSARIQSGEFTQASFATMVEDLSFNTDNINLAGLAQTGIVYA